jgi:two-component system KDP operon response regulator KdpE
VADLSVLLVEDEPAVAEVISTALTSRGYRVHATATGRLALDRASDEEPDMVILDLGLPDIDGVEVCRQLRRWYTNPIVVLSADGAEDRKIAALDEGADDYITKPFSMPELLARLRVADRHRRSASSAFDPPVLRVGDVVVDTGSHEATVAGGALDLTRREFALLAVLARHPGRVLTHGTLLERAWGGTRRGGVESLRVHVTQLRKKLGTGDQRPGILSEPGVGYRLNLPEAP